MLDDEIPRERIVSGNEVRVPVAARGTATIVRRYRERRAVVLHPDDYARLIEDNRVVAGLGRVEPPAALTQVERRVHAIATMPGADASAIEDYDALSAWLAGGES